ncbi:peptidoglycan DD-metalloendopeptidase family protein [bacterium]|nr:peptidoglycan DD-metalloendopeptidase family protein [bacterium]
MPATPTSDPGLQAPTGRTRSWARPPNRTGGAIEKLLRATLNSYAVLVFTSHPVPAVMVLLASFYHPVVGGMGLIGALLATITARWLQANEEALQAGIFGVSGLLVGLAMGMYAPASLRMWTFLLLGAVLVGILAVFLGSYLARYDMPILSAPFMMVIWPVLLTIGVERRTDSGFLSVGMLGGLDHWLADTLPEGVYTYIEMFGNILFQHNLISGVLVILAIALYSRISTGYALWGGLLGLATHFFFTGGLDGFNGLNYVLTALAFGGFFIIANLHAFLFTTIAAIAVGMVNLATQEVLDVISNGDEAIPSLVFAFNVITLTFLFPLKITLQPHQRRDLLPVPLAVIRSPEANLRWYRRWLSRRHRQKTMLTLPFMGEWTVLQGHDGEWTHKGKGRYAWDFVVRDGEGKQFDGFGLQVTDYYCFSLPVLAPAPGTIFNVQHTVEDNPPRSESIEQNWGNHLMIDHGNGEYTLLAHFRQHSITVAPGQHVQRGQILGYCGNSGRSPVPHIHMQLQSKPELGADSLPAMFSEGVRNGEIEIALSPDKEDRLKPVDLDGEAELTLLGHEGERRHYRCSGNMFKRHETLHFSTDAWGVPAIKSDRSLWYIIDTPHFQELIPDYRTFPSLLERSSWIRAIGESLVLPKQLKVGLQWKGGRVSEHSGDFWTVQSNGRRLLLDTRSQVIRSIELIEPAGRSCELEGVEFPE